MTSLPFLHSVIDPFQWPSPVQRIAQLLQRPLPTYPFTVLHPFVSQRAGGLFQELSCCSSVDNDNCVPNERPLTDVFDIVLSTVSELHELGKSEDYESPWPTVPLWSTLIKALGHACSKDISIMGEVAFIRPRPPTSERRSYEDLDGIATVLLSYVVDSINCYKPHSPENLNVEPRMTDNDSVLIEDIIETRAETSSTVSIDVPFEAHVLPGRGRRFCAVLPLLCVADEDNICFLLSSVLYQRYVWGIDEPVVGISFSNTGTIGRVVFGWLDARSSDSDNLPTVNIARAAVDSVPDAALGVFDLTDATSAFAFAQFILGLDVHFRSIISSTSDRQMHALGWRSDHITIDDEIDGEQWGRVERWTHDVDMSDNSSSEDPSFPHTPSSQDISLSPHVLLSTDTSESSSSIPPKLREPPHEKFDVMRPAMSSDSSDAPCDTTNEDSSTGTSARSLPLSPLPSPSLLSTSDREDCTSIVTWLLERNAWTIGVIELPFESPENFEINTKIKVYHSMTKLLWPAEWSTVDALPKVDAGVEDIRQHLFQQYERMRDKAGPDDVLKEGHASIIQQRFSLILWASIGAFSLQAAALGRSVNEAEAHHDWDAVLYRMLSSPGESVSCNVLLGRTIRLSRNDIADRSDSCEAIASQLSLTKEYLNHCSDAQCGSRKYDDDAVQDQALAASIHAFSFGDVLRSLDPITYLDNVKRRASPEPRTGTCDALFVTPVSLGDIPDKAKVKDYLNKFGPVIHVKPSAEGQKDVKSTGSIPAPKSLSPKDTNIPRNPLSSETPSISVHSYNLSPSGFVVKHDKRSYGKEEAFNEELMCIVSLVTYLAALGIKGFPVFGLLTSGQTGRILMAWQSETTDKIHIMDRNTRTFDLSSPIDVFQFAMFLIRLREHTDTLRDVLNERRDAIVEKAEKGELRRWTKEAQAGIADVV